MRRKTTTTPGTPRGSNVKSRIFCEDSSPSYNAIKKEKYNGIPLILSGISYTRIGNDMILNHKTNRIESYESK